MMQNSGEILEEQQPSTAIPDKMYVMVGKDVKENESTLKWALHHLEGRKLCICHVHQRAQKIPIMGTKFSINQLEEHQVQVYHEEERENMHKILDIYGVTCIREGVAAEKLYIEMDSIEKGIVELISQHRITKLVIGAAADKLYSRKMTEPRSKKAIFVRQQAPVFCHIWFVCKGQLIYTREGVEVTPLPLQVSQISEGLQSTGLRSRSVTEEQNEKMTGLVPELQRGRSDNCDRLSGRHSERSQFSTYSSSEVISDSASISFSRTGHSVSTKEFNALPHSDEDHCHSSPHSVLDGSVDDSLYDWLEKYILEAENSRHEAYVESIRCRKAEKDAIEAICRVKASETLYAEELRQRKDIVEALAGGKEEIEGMKKHLNELMEELRVAQEQKSSLECQIEISEMMVQQLEEKLFSAVELLQNYRKERDELQVERDNVLRIAEGLSKRLVEEASNTCKPQFFSEFSFAEIEEATCNFDPSLKIGEGGYGKIYKAILRQTQVAIKTLGADSLQGPSEFQQEVNILSKLRHPNLITLIGACPEAWILIYEYLPNGSLEDRLSCKDDTPPLSWQTRIRIAAELCSVLIFLHSSSPHSIVHGDLKPSNILLDANYVSKLSDFGICRVVSQDEFASNNTTLCCRTGPKGTFAYMDPEFVVTGELTPKSDVYSFGIILLRLLTGRQAMGIKNEVQYALDKGNLRNLLDPTAGDWPFVQAKELAHLAMSCCEMHRRSRPDLASEVWRVLEPMRVSCGFSLVQLSSEEHCQIPPYFICPIRKELMKDPVVAADGFTYEAEALREWLDSGHATSPTTNLKLTHYNLVPNRALQCAIQQWLQHGNI